MATTLLGWYWQLNLLLALAFGVWLLIRVIARWPGLALGGKAQLDWVRGVLAGVLTLMLVMPMLQLLLPAATSWSRGLADQWTVLAGMQDVAAQTKAAVLAQGWQQLVIAALILGWSVQAIVLARRWLQLRRIVAAATAWKQVAGVQLRISDEISIPFATGALGGAAIVMPAALLPQPQHWRLSLRHELQHVRNGDLAWVLALELLRAFCFWNPLVLLWQRELEILHELACDEALVVNKRVDSQTYGNCLLDIAQAHNEPAWLGAAAMVCWQRWFHYNPSLLRRRIMRINKMQQEKHSRAKSALYGVLVASGLLGSSLLVMAAEVQNANAADIVPTGRTSPEYPVKALSGKLEGWVRLRFSLDDDGNVIDPSVVESCAGPDEMPCELGDETFAESARNALAKWKYEPRKANDSQSRSNLETLIRFQLTK